MQEYLTYPHYDYLPEPLRTALKVARHGLVEEEGNESTVSEELLLDLFEWTHKALPDFPQLWWLEASTKGVCKVHNGALFDIVLYLKDEWDYKSYTVLPLINEDKDFLEPVNILNKIKSNIENTLGMPLDVTGEGIETLSKIPVSTETHE